MAESNPVETETNTSPYSWTISQDALAKLTSRNLDTRGITLSDKLPKSSLRESGIAMINALGEGERMIIQRIGSEDLSSTLFLSDDEYGAARAEAVPVGIDQERLVEISRDMEAFIKECHLALATNAALYPENTQVGLSSWVNLLKIVYSHLSDLEKKKTPFWKRTRVLNSIPIEEERPTIEKVVSEIRGDRNGISEVRGIPIGQIILRGEGRNVLGNVCPVIDCAGRFASNEGIVITDSSGEITGQPGTDVRINSVIAHLASHGINNNGNPMDNSQRYITIREYLQIFDKRDKSAELLKLDPYNITLEIATKLTRIVAEKAKVNLSEEEIKKMAEDYLNFRL